MKTKILLIFGTILLFNNLQKSNCEYPKKNRIEIVNTIWYCKLFENCNDFIEFNEDSNYFNYSCETNDTFSGQYYFCMDTLILHEFLIKDSSGFIPYDEESIYKLIFIEDKLKFIGKMILDKSDGQPKWKNFNFDFNDMELYERIK